MTTTAAHNIMAPVMRPLQESSVSRPRAVYSIDQILGNQTKRSGKCAQNKILLSFSNLQKPSVENTLIELKNNLKYFK